MIINLKVLPKDCDCITHDGLHWLHADKMTFDLNLEMFKRGNTRGYLVSEAARLQEKSYQMSKYKPAPNDTFIFPDGYSEKDYEAQLKAVLNEKIGATEVS